MSTACMHACTVQVEIQATCSSSHLSRLFLPPFLPPFSPAFFLTCRLILILQCLSFPPILHTRTKTTQTRWHAQHHKGEVYHTHHPPVSPPCLPLLQAQAEHLMLMRCFLPRKILVQGHTSWGAEYRIWHHQLMSVACPT
jgi:hypothetical protein